MSTDPAPAPTEHHPHHARKHRIEKFEGAADIMVVVGIVLLGIAMVAGLLTASGSIHI
jgi:hypothetical protein